MSGLNNLQTRLQYLGGNAEGRIIKGKLQSLKKALLYSYQAATAVLADGREFRCLINKDQLNNDYDNKILSIPFRDICLNKDRVGTTTQGEEEIGVKPGDIIEWKETATHWIVYLRYLEEDAYFRGDLRKCQEAEMLDGTRFWAYIRGPKEQTIDWKSEKNIYFNELNYTLEMYVPKTKENLDKFKRFSIIKINGNSYEVQATDSISLDGIIEVHLKEYFNNNIAEAASKENQAGPDEEIDPALPHIEGQTIVYPYDEALTYTVIGATGDWYISNPKLARISDETSDSVTIDIITGKSGEFILFCGSVNLPIVIKSL